MSNQKTPDPSIDILEGKNRLVQVRISDRELQIIDDSAEKTGLSRSEYVRARALKRVYTSQKHLPEPDYAKLMLNYRELRAQGNNLNQIAKALNTARLRGEQIDVWEQVRTAIEANSQTVKKIRMALR